MSPADRKSSVGAETTINNTPNMPNGKATAAAPKLSDDDHVELADMLPNGPATSPEEDIMQLARLGDVQAIEKLYESEKFDATYCDAEGITPLHVFCPQTTCRRMRADRCSGLPLTINMPCANSSSKPVPT
jgi:ankyrin repeat protein